MERNVRKLIKYIKALWWQKSSGWSLKFKKPHNGRNKFEKSKWTSLSIDERIIWELINWFNVKCSSTNILGQK